MNYKVLPIKPEETYDWLLHKHYARRIPSISFAYGLYDKKELIGVCTFGKPASKPLCEGLLGKKYSYIVFELNRLVINEGVKVNSLSYFIGKCLKLLPRPLAIVSYADTSQHHHGYIYQATNWIYTGLSDKRKNEWQMKNSSLHNKTICERYTLEERQSNPNFIKKERPRKHRYVYFVGSSFQKKAWKKLLKYPILPYPKGDNKKYDASYQPKTQGILFS